MELELKVKVIGESLKLNPTLTQLNLSRNRIGDEGAKVIFKSLSLNSTLTQLNIGCMFPFHNQHTICDFESVATMLVVPPHFVRVGLVK